MTAIIIRVKTITITSTDIAKPFQFLEFAFDPTSSLKNNHDELLLKIKNINRFHVFLI